MNEVRFIHEHRALWQKFENALVDGSRISPDELSDLYIHLLDDLSYAKTHFPDSKIVLYLNQLAVDAHQSIYRRRRENWRRFITFFTQEVPDVVQQNYRYFIYSALIFTGAIAFGVVSARIDPAFTNSILSDEYVSMTLENIKNDDPLAVYKSAKKSDMFFFISTNNVRVAIMTYIFGIVAGIPTVFFLFMNGVMVGAFLYFFIDHGLWDIALTTIFLHGALELTAIVIAGACGMLLGAGLIFPGTYNRVVSVRQAAKKSLKIVIGIMPFILLAAFIESYVTRYYLELGSAGRLVVIISSSALLIWYFFIYPQKRKYG